MVSSTTTYTYSTNNLIIFCDQYSTPLFIKQQRQKLFADKPTVLIQMFRYFSGFTLFIEDKKFGLMFAIALKELVIGD